MNQNPYAPPTAPVYYAPEPEIVAATRWERFRAKLADGLVFVVPGIGMALLMPMFLGQGDRGMAAIMGILALLWLVGCVVWNIVLLVQNGQTLGKKIVGIRIINPQGENPGFWKIALVRGLPFAVVGTALNLALKSPLPNGLVTLVDALFIFGPTRRCLHDVLADTHVIRA
jgi:uncharacterized RDD family membrane protein YckC